MAAQVTPRARGIGSAKERVHADAERMAGLSLLALSSAFLVVTMLAASIAPDYDFHAAAISDLGVTAQTAVLFNGLLVVIGLLNIAAGYALFGRQRRGLLTLYVLAGIGAIGAGLFPLSTGGVHAIFALVAFVGFNVEVIGSALPLVGPLRVIGIVAGGVGLLYAVLMVIGDSGNTAVFGPIGHGGSERMIAYPAMLWLLAFAGYLMGDGAETVEKRSSSES